jgi:hypothetical protein
MNCLQQFVSVAELTRHVPLQVNLWKPQNIYSEMKTTVWPEMRRCASLGNQEARLWVEKFLILGENLGFATAAQTK